MSDPDPHRTAAHSSADPSATDPNRTTDLARPDTSVDSERTGPHVSDAAVLPAMPGYEIEGQLGRGGMGVVYKARQLELNRAVAIKMILGGKYTDPLAQARFLVEAEVIARLSHPRIVQVYEFGRCEDQPYFVLEFVGGGSLADRLRQGKFAPREAASLVAELADGMAAAHQKGVVHRDLKPANVLLQGARTNGHVANEGDQSTVFAPRSSPPAASSPKIADFGLAKIGESDMTASGAVMGTPSYMAPEQAAGKTREVGTPADVYALGVILYECLTGRPPFKGDTAMATIQQVLTREPVRLRSVDPNIPRDLETICLKCLEKDVPKRYAAAADLAADLRAYLDGRPIAARPVGTVERTWKWVKRNPGRAAAIATAMWVFIGAGVAANEVRKQREADHVAAENQRTEDRIAAEKQRADDRIAAEAKRHADVRIARAAELVNSLATADTARLPELLRELDSVRDLTEPGLRDLARQPVTTRAGLHARLVLIRAADQNEQLRLLGELAGYLRSAPPDVLVVVIAVLKPLTTDRFDEIMWLMVDAVEQPEFARLRSAAMLAHRAPNDSRWNALAPSVVGWLVRQPAVELGAWVRAFEPVRHLLVPPLMRRYPSALARVRGGTLSQDELLAAVGEVEMSVNLLAHSAIDRPADLAEMAVIADAQHYRLFADAIRKSQRTVVPLLKAELEKRAANSSEADPRLAEMAKRRGHAAAVLVALGDGEAAWSLFAHPKDGDPTARSYLVARLAAIAADPVAVVTRFDAEPDVSAKRALLIALGEFPPQSVPPAFAERLLVLYREHPDSGLHSAIDWLLRQKWGKAADLAAIDAALARRPKGREPASADCNWYVNGEGQTFAVVRGPVEFRMGSPLNEPDRPREPGEADTELPHRKRIGRTYAISTREVTVAEFLKFRPKHSWPKKYSPDPNGPAVGVTWYDAAEYCNWLNRREGIPGPEWRYGANEDEEYAEGMQIWPGRLAKSGYRLPTEAEWEYAARAGSPTARYYGRGEELLGRYAWSFRNSGEQAMPCSRLRPNDLGLFDVLGNAYEWSEDAALVYLPQLVEDEEAKKYLTVSVGGPRILRGGAFDTQPMYLRSATRIYQRPPARLFGAGFRVVRTLR